MDRAKIDLWVGIFVAIGIAALFILALKVGNMGNFNASDTYTIGAYFENVGGLKPRAPVKSAGVVVGRVVGVTFDNQRYEALVTLGMDQRFKFPKDTTATILTSGLLGEQYIGLEPGGDEAVLKNDDKITHTQDAVVLEKLIGQFLYNKAEGGTDNKSTEPGK